MPRSDKHTELSSTTSVLCGPAAWEGPSRESGACWSLSWAPTTVGKPRVRTLFLVTTAKGRAGFSGLDSELIPRNKKTKKRR